MRLAEGQASGTPRRRNCQNLRYSTHYDVGCIAGPGRPLPGHSFIAQHSPGRCLYGIRGEIYRLRKRLSQRRPNGIDEIYRVVDIAVSVKFSIHRLHSDFHVR